MIEFTKPLYLFLLVPLGYYTYHLSRHSLADLSRFRSRLATILRLMILLALVFALAGARMVQDVSRQCIVFVLDVSDSIPKTKQDRALAYVNKALSNLKRNQKVGLIAFGGDASVELAPSSTNKIDKVYSLPRTNETDIAQALGLALALFPEQAARKIVLLSDGNETRGKAIEQAMLASSNNVSIDVVPVSGELPHETLLDKMMCPGSVKVGEPFDLKIVAAAKEPTAAQIRMLRNGAPAGVKRVELAKGKSILTVQQSIDKPGSYEFEAILECNRDALVDNNIALAHTIVKGKPRVLYVEGATGQERYLAEALGRSDIEVEVRNRSGMPNTLAQLRGYDMVVLSDVPAWNLAPEQMAMIKSGVKDLGIGFTMIGGESSFGSGGYYDTPVEEALPLDMSIRKTKVLPSLSVVIVMDKSGSMSATEGGRTKISLANDAAAAVVKLLQPIDYVGIIVCHSDPVTAVRLQPARDKNPIYGQISTIRAEGGGIAVFPSMRMAATMIGSASTRQKHVILLADGADCDEQEGVLPLVKQMAAQKITITAVAIGDGPHVPFLKAVAAFGKGDFYLTRQARDLKAIFTKDVMAASKSLVIEEPFVPEMDASSPELSGISTDSVPPLLGYVATSPKPMARVSMLSHKKDPILATWQYGLGRSAAFTPDCKARWSARWLTWPHYTKFWAQVLRSTMRKSTSTDFQTTVDIASGTGHVTIDAVDDKGNFLNLLKFIGSVVGPEMRSRSLAIEQTGPGRYEATFDARDIGSYVVNIARKDQSRSAPEVNVMSVPYPPEYKDIAPNTTLLKRLASETSGAFAPEASDVLSRNFRRSRAHTDLWRVLVLIAVLALPIDIAVRRLALSPAQFAEFYVTALEHIRSSRGVRKSRTIEQVETVSTLLTAKRERSAKLKESKQAMTDRLTPLTQAKQPLSEASHVPSASEQEIEEQPSPETSVASRLLEAKKKRQQKDS